MSKINTPQLKIACINGVERTGWDNNWLPRWQESVQTILEQDQYQFNLDIKPFSYTKHYEACDWENNAKTVAQMCRSDTDGALARIFRATKSLDPISEELKWRAKTFASWAEDSCLRETIQTELTEFLIEFKPDIILAHGFGSILAYDSLLQLSKPFTSNRHLRSHLDLTWAIRLFKASLLVESSHCR